MNEKTSSQIFISYRRNGSDAHARIFYEKLKECGYSVFLDFESLFSGGYEKNILNAIDDCTDFIVLLPKDGLVRCQDAEDLMRKEIAEALKAQKNIIPVFINGFKMPEKKELPEELARLAEENGIECRMEYFDAVFEKLLCNLISVPQDEYGHTVLRKIKQKTLGISHPYFKKWIFMKLEMFLSENDSFFCGTNWTNPHAEDTFGVSGIDFTKHTLKATTSVNDYWQDGFTIAYLKRQAELIRRGVKIQRVFFLEPGSYERSEEQMAYQHSLGIDVYYIERDNEYIDPSWLTEDYLIQDDELLVQIYCTSHTFDSQCQDNEEITMDPIKVRRKAERFQRILERSKKYTPKGPDQLK